MEQDKLIRLHNKKIEKLEESTKNICDNFTYKLSEMEIKMQAFNDEINEEIKKLGKRTYNIFITVISILGTCVMEFLRWYLLC